MTLRLVLGVDPGNSGAIAALADGEPAGFLDMPVRARDRGEGWIVDAPRLAAGLRGLLLQHAGAHVVVVTEAVGSMPSDSAHRAFRFGQGDGMIRGVLGALGLQLLEVTPQTWKKHFGLIGSAKDVARQVALGRWPHIGVQLMRVKDGGRADSLLVATWAHETEAWIPSATPAKPRRKKPTRARELAPA